MIKKLAGAILVPVILVGCASMLPHYRFDDTAVISQAEGMAIAMTCVEKGLAPGQLVYAYGYAVSQLLSVSVYDKSLYEETFQRKKSDLVNNFYYSYECGEISSQFPQMTDNILRQHSGIMQDRQIALTGLSQSAASFGSNMPTYNQQSIPMPSGQVNFGLPENKINHYLVDFGSGQRMCTLTSSGYVFCN